MVTFSENSKKSNKIKLYDFHYRFRSFHQQSNMQKEKWVQKIEHLMSVKIDVYLTMMELGLHI